MSIIEFLIYIVLVSAFLINTIFAAYSMMMSGIRERDEVPVSMITSPEDVGNISTKRGFVALISATMIATALLLVAIGMSERVGALYDQVLHREYRLVVEARATACFDQALLKLSQDYFYVPKIGGDILPAFACTIEKVSSDNLAIPYERNILVGAQYAGVRGNISGSIQMDSGVIHILYQKFILF